ncbi:hypothetical protein [Rothia mucilaginosa]
MPTASNSEQTTQPGRQSNSKVSNTWLKIREILNNKWVLSIISTILIIIIWTPCFITGHEWNSPNVHWLPISLMLTIIFVTILFLWKKVWFLKNVSQFNSWIFGVTIIGGTIAFLLPLAIADNFSSNGEGTALRQMLIYTTGGLLGVITLSETRRKNDLEKSKFTEQQDQFRKQLEAQKANLESQLDAQKKTLSSQLEAQKENLESQLKAQHDNLELQLTSQEKKDKRDHSREVHAERRSRYTKAVEQLAHEKAAVRLGGIYTLVGLVDEWLADKSIKDKDDRRKEGQVIINNLCSYIRSPFKLAEKRATLESDTQPDNYQGNFFEDQVKLFEEQDVRRSIFNEMSTRIHPLNEEEEEEKLDCITWDVFEFNFQKSTVFYPLNRLTFFSPDFRNSKFFGPTDFEFSVFREIPIFQGTQYFGDADFSGAHFQGTALFQNSYFERELSFNVTTLSAGAVFDNSIFKGSTKIIPILQGNISFNDALFSCSSTHSFTQKSDHPDMSKINLGYATLLDKPFNIPLGAVLFDPDSWDEQNKEYASISKPAE